MDDRFRRNRQLDRRRVWRLRRGSPFPDELQIVYDGIHAGIKPSIAVTREQLKEVS